MKQNKLAQFLAFWVANSLSLIVLSMIVKNSVVLGNSKVSMLEAAILSGLILTVVGGVVDQFVRKSGMVESLVTTFKSAGMKMKAESIWGMVYLVVNIILVWVIKKFALIVGLGVSDILFTLIVAVVLTGAQWAAAIATGASNSGKK